MKKLLLSVLALGAMTGVALADPVKMTDQQMSTVVAGSLVDFDLNLPITVTTPTNVSCNAAICAGGNNGNQVTNVAVQSADFRQFVIFSTSHRH